MLDLRSLEIFYWVVRLRSFRGAAERVHTSQPAVSTRIAQLEADLGIRLFDRERNRPVIPTQKGLELFAYVERIIGLHQEMVSSIKGDVEAPRYFRLGASETIVHTWLGSLVRQVNQRYPALSIEITVDVSASLRHKLTNGEIDLAFLLDPVFLPQVVSLPLARYPMAWLASPKLQLSARRLGLAELGRWPILTYASNTEPYQRIKHLFSGLNGTPVRLFGNSSLASIIRMTIDGIGIGAIPIAVVKREIETGSLDLLTAEVELPALSFGAIYIDTPGAGFTSIFAHMAREIAQSFADELD